jgi:hypothetical protein
MYTTLKSIKEETKTRVKFSKLQLVYVKNIQEAITITDNNNELDVALIRLIISLLA